MAKIVPKRGSLGGYFPPNREAPLDFEKSMGVEHVCLGKRRAYVK
jgi:hypothetical protein